LPSLGQGPLSALLVAQDFGTANHLSHFAHGMHGNQFDLRVFVREHAEDFVGES